MSDVILAEKQIQDFLRDNFGAKVFDMVPHTIVDGPFAGHEIFEVETDFQGGSSFWAINHPQIAVRPHGGHTINKALEEFSRELCPLLTQFSSKRNVPEPHLEVENKPSPVLPAASGPMTVEEATPRHVPDGPARLAPQMSPEEKFYIGGTTDQQYVVANLAPGEGILAEPEALLFMTDGIEMKTVALNGVEGGSLIQKLSNPLRRVVSGENFFVTAFRNILTTPQNVAFAAPHLGSIIPFPLNQAGSITCQRGAYLCGTPDVAVAPVLAKKLAAQLFSGEGLLLQKISGVGLAFIHVGGSVIHRNISPGESLRIESGSLAAWDSALDFSVKMNKGMNLFGGEGLWLSSLKNTGDAPMSAWIQTLPFERLAQRIHAKAPQNKISKKKG